MNGPFSSKPCLITRGYSHPTLAFRESFEPGDISHALPVELHQMPRTHGRLALKDCDGSHLRAREKKKSWSF